MMLPVCSSALILQGLFPHRRASDGAVNASSNFPSPGLGRDNGQDRVCGTLPGIVGFSEMIFSTADPTRFT